MEMSFQKTEEGMALMAAYVGGLIKSGVGFRIHQYECDVVVKLTGGF